MSLRGPHALRWRLSLTLGVTLFVGYLDRMNISLAMPLIAQHYGWSLADTRSQGASLMTLFYVGYGLANLFLSGAATRLGPRTSLLGVIGLWSVFTALGAWLSASLVALLATRLLLGLSEGVHFPMMNVLTQRWFPAQERGRANSVWMAGLLLAICLAPVILIPLMHAIGWQASFWVLSAAGPLLSMPLVWRHVFNRPTDHPALSAQERQHIEQDQTMAEPSSPTRHALRHAMTRPGMLLILAAGMAYNVVAVGLSSWLPTYFVANKGLAYSDLVYATSLPYVTGVIGLAVWSLLGDRLGARAALGAVGFVGGGAALWFALHAPTLPWSIAGFSAAVFCISAFSACEFAIVQQQLPPEVVGSGAGIYNGLTTLIGGGLGPVVVSSLIGTNPEGQAQGVAAAITVCLLAAALLATLARRLRY
jgi:sugar phosphate permease